MSDSLVSIIVPVYKVEKYLEKCVNSIRNQHYTNLEILLIDDGSPDSCPQICDQLAEKDHRIKVIHQKNMGLSSARNTGIDHSHGDFLAFIDSDDFISPDMISILVDRCTKDQSQLALCNFTYIDNDGSCNDLDISNVKSGVYTQKQFWDKYYDVESYAYCVVAWNKLYSKELFQNVRYENGKLHEDEFIIHKIIAQCNRISFITDSCYFYLQRADSITGKTFSVRNLDGAEAMLARGSYFYECGYYDLARKSIIQSISVIQKGYHNVSRSDDVSKRRLRELHSVFRKQYLKLIQKCPSFRFIVNGGLFFIGSGIYGLKEKIQKII